ncbi:hypothetical protein [Rheinheimera sp. MMS21-TC3]|uniref:hypothetical protein n=1 Tax=Rheinheimera sp. MMS21-TC3 TaxID=3072790 RepID=UPI0028C3D270|nr:hypothetical protein [Rheinheimera sp. MMS21-TC3]WNO59647.1 hypothetical protein RDV63_01410 [Rheinheimera sp. MMS21-TC3]
MKLYNRKTLISSAPEGRPPSSTKSSFTQWFYFLFVVFLVGYLLYLLIKPYFMIEANGLVDVEVKDIVAERSGVLSEIYVVANQPFKKGDLIAKIVPEKHCPIEDDTPLEKLGYDMEVLRNDIKALKQEHDFFTAQQVSPTNIQRALEVNASLFKTQQKEQQSVQQTLEKLNIDIQRAKAKLAIMATRRENLLLTKQSQSVSPDCVVKEVFAFEDGRVNEVRVLSQGYAEKGHPIIKFQPNDAKVSVVFLADAKLYNSFAKQPQLIVTFPNGAESFARIERIGSIASRESGNLNDLLVQNEVSLRMTLRPVNATDNELWRSHERLPVVVRGGR